MASLRSLFVPLMVLFVAAYVVPSCDAWGVNRDYDGRKPLFGVVTTDENDHSHLEDMEQVPDAFLFFVALARWFG